MTRENPCYSYTEHEVKDEMRYYIYVSPTKYTCIYVPIYEIAQHRSHNTSDITTSHFLKTKLFILLGPIINMVKNDDEPVSCL